VTQGFGNWEIAEQLVLAKRTVDSHIEHIFSKLGFAACSGRVAVAGRASSPSPL
jgi:DNA-binding NarL/FixJ family response regulator